MGKMGGGGRQKHWIVWCFACITLQSQSVLAPLAKGSQKAVDGTPSE